MKISISVGALAKDAFETVIESGTVTGLSLENCTLTFDYTGLDPNAALQRAVDNQMAITEALDRFVAEDDVGMQAGSAMPWAIWRPRWHRSRQSRRSRPVSSSP